MIFSGICPILNHQGCKIIAKIPDIVRSAVPDNIYRLEDFPYAEETPALTGGLRAPFVHKRTKKARRRIQTKRKKSLSRRRRQNNSYKALSIAFLSK